MQEPDSGDSKPDQKGVPMPAELPLPELEANLVALASDLAAAEGRWLLMVAEFDRREGWAGIGVLSCAHWLSWRLGLGLVTAREKVRVARALADLPKTAAAFQKGELSYCRTRAIVRAATPENEENLIEIARNSTGAQLERIMRSTAQVQRIEAGVPRVRERSVNWHWDDDGSLVFRARLDPEEGAALLNALEAARLPDPPADAVVVTASIGDGPPPAEAATPPVTAPPVTTVEEWAESRVDALVAIAEAFIGNQAPVSGADVYQVVVHVRDDAAPHVEDGPPLPVETALRLACDSTVYCVHQNAKGDVLNIGRRSRKIPWALRRALKLLDGGCRFPACTRRRRVDGHHVRHWTRGGPTALANLLLLCRRHHGLVHEGGFGLTMTSDGRAIFTRPDGTVLAENPEPEQSTKAPDQWHDVPVSPGAIETRWAGDRLRQGYVVAGIVQQRKRPIA
jgi:Domain of unknown function (DUF222)